MSLSGIAAEGRVLAAPISADAVLSAERFGARAVCLQRLIRLGLPVPCSVAIGFAAVHRIADGGPLDMAALLAPFGPLPLVSVRPSSGAADWGGPRTILDVGMNDAVRNALARDLGPEAAQARYLNFIRAYAADVARLDPDTIEAPFDAVDPVAVALTAYERATDAPFPQDPAEQLAQVLKSMARAWEGVSARLLRQAQGAPADAGLGLVVQEMATGLGHGESGTGVIRSLDPVTGAAGAVGEYRRQATFGEARRSGAMMPLDGEAGPTLRGEAPALHAELVEMAALCRQKLRDEMEIRFAIADGKLWVIDAIPARRSARAAVAAAVRLAEEGIISKQEAVLRVDPGALPELLHRRVDPAAKRDVILKGIGASPGGATGRLTFSARAALAAEAHEIPCILIRRETTPEDIRGMQAARAIVTERGGMTSHAAVIARGLGLPCIAGASGLRVSTRNKTMTIGGRVFREGDIITVDGTTGEAMAGAIAMQEPSLDGPFATLLDWADGFRDIGVRANADTPAGAAVAHRFAAEGIGLCRTEHMFFEPSRLAVMREMIFTDSPTDRAAALEQLLPMQRQDFMELFRIMAGHPVCIRLFDPPLHEFLPTDREGLTALAESLDLPLSDVIRRVDSITEFNPMLGLRGVRLGVTQPEIYEMQVRAIFEATVEASRIAGAAVVPEIMIPLVSAKREVELIKTRIDGVAAAVRNASGQEFRYRLCVLVETPRAALRAGEIAVHADILSFGTNDLTQMTYGLSRDDAGRFMSSYVSSGVFPEDPFHTLDKEGVGELLMMGASRGRKARPDIILAVCGEHAGNVDTIDFVRKAGFTYVSCSPYRVPVARLAAAHLALRDRLEAVETQDAASA
ncbi:putative PEP-binding protein [Tropicimonas sp. IMCC34043]|uniref:putative PEP-binding protein n=1 Tax=Tropicimonas sp. IMCC34043 TaxID=2248760 RepID=UPI000E24EA7E|nr:putative PEP-binding protein [Tropicimonas sp. IMCC34043]